MLESFSLFYRVFLLLTDHEYSEVEEKGMKIKIQPVYEWTLEMEMHSYSLFH